MVRKDMINFFIGIRVFSVTLILQLLGNALWNKHSFFTSITSWIIERLDRKLADAIDSNIVEKCDVTILSTRNLS